MKSKAITLLAICLLANSAGADVTVIRTLKIKPLATEGQIEARGMLRLQGQNSRRDTEIVVDGADLANTMAFPPRLITLVSLDQGVVHRLDAERAEFEKFSLSGWRKYLDQRSEESAQLVNSTRQITQSWSRVLPETGAQTIQNIPCSKFVYEWHFQVWNPDTYTKKEYKVKTTLWLTAMTAKIQRTLAEEAVFKTAYHNKLGGAPLEDLNGITLQYAESVTGIDKHTLFTGINEGTARLKRIQGYPITSDTEWELVGTKTSKPLFTVHAELRFLSLEPLAAAVFTPVAPRRPNGDSTAESTAQLISRAR